MIMVLFPGELKFQYGSSQILSFLTGFRFLVLHENVYGLWQMLRFQELLPLSPAHDGLCASNQQHRKLYIFFI